jgi:hypothetical protein
MIIKGRENVGLGQTFCPYQWLYIFIRARCHKALTSIKREKKYLYLVMHLRPGCPSVQRYHF